MTPLAQVLREIRQRRGLSQGAFARLGGVDRTVVCRWESGQRQPSLGTLRHLAVMLRLPAAERLAVAVTALAAAPADGGGTGPQQVQLDAGEVAAWREGDAIRLSFSLADGGTSVDFTLPLQPREALLLAAVLAGAALPGAQGMPPTRARMAPEPRTGGGVVSKHCERTRGGSAGRTARHPEEERCLSGR